ncbi:MAG: hypothetical protein JWO38_5390 [Gemmataceae bacterium]|nr:hypothetical protein [Gemmataceae bacterium]
MWARVLVAVAILGLSGWVHGRWTDRWGAPPAVAEAAAVLPALPMTIGEWDGRDITADQSEAVYRALEHQVLRQYVHRRTGAAVGVLFTCGRAAPMIYEHTPRACYAATGFEEIGAGTRITVDGGAGPAGEFLVHTFAKSSAASTTRLRLFWAWGDRTTWSSPVQPRFTLGRKPVLFKVYVARQLLSETEPLADDPAVRFLRALLPELQATINPPPG